jgi:hypothetical protein
MHEETREVASPPSGAQPSRARLAAEAWESLFRTQVALMRRFESDGDFAPLRPREYDVLFTLSLAGGRRLRLRDLNDQVFMTQPSLSRMVDRLEGRGLVAGGSSSPSPRPASPCSGRSAATTCAASPGTWAAPSTRTSCRRSRS